MTDRQAKLLGLQRARVIHNRYWTDFYTGLTGRITKMERELDGLLEVETKRRCSLLKRIMVFFRE